MLKSLFVDIFNYYFSPFKCVFFSKKVKLNFLLILKKESLLILYIKHMKWNEFVYVGRDRNVIMDF